jgi:hypothetical protein
MDFGPRHRGSVQRATALRGVRLRSVSCHRAYLQRLFTTSFRSDINYLWGFFSTHTIFFVNTRFAGFALLLRLALFL